MKMKTLSEYFKRDSAYWGERSDWFVVAIQTRDSDCLTRSNFRSMAKAIHTKAGGVVSGFESWGLKGTQEINPVLAIEEANHWACGWIQYLVLAPEAKNLVEFAKSLLDNLESYPVLDENDFSNLETEEADEVWRNCYRPKERVEYIREHASQFEFRSFQDLLGCVRGKYFAGYASELLN